ncbi:hypothetical protein D9756_010623 [Leucocoprinus leucothites]|uniref:Uncharacterized protein n=1 Tax=Leucocoprinus leucothites TaxID=201217 RepID=A0A8H5CTN8_9AGAR|nr:hypothetical protein D9756_010623 [Leucoagaricus leucothites]
MKKRGVTPGVLKDGEEAKVVFDVVRESIDLEVEAPAANENGLSSDYFTGSTNDTGEYFTSQRAAEAEEYIRDVVYGGVDGLAYVRSLAEFVRSSSIGAPSYPVHPASDLGLGMSLEEYVEDIVDELTEGRHSLLCQTAEQLRLQVHYPVKPDPSSALAVQTAASLYLAPKAAIALQALLQIRLQKIDMSALINKPEELFLSEEEWAGKGLKAKRKSIKEKVDALVRERPRTAERSDAMEVEEDPSVQANANGLAQSSSSTVMNPSVLEMEGPEELAEVLDYVADLIIEFNQRINGVGGTVSLRADSSAMPDLSATAGKANGANEMPSVASDEENATLRNLRLNLLALAKRAPLDTIARLPLELVPEHIRHYIPTLDTSATTSPSAPSTGVTTPVYAAPVGITGNGLS